MQIEDALWEANMYRLYAVLQSCVVCVPNSLSHCLPPELRPFWCLLLHQGTFSALLGSAQLHHSLAPFSWATKRSLQAETKAVASICCLPSKWRAAWAPAGSCSECPVVSKKLASLLRPSRGCTTLKRWNLHSRFNEGVTFLVFHLCLGWGVLGRGEPATPGGWDGTGRDGGVYPGSAEQQGGL